MINTERLRVIDVLRGFALLGILTVNIEMFAGPESVHDIPLGLLKSAFTGWHRDLDIAILTLKWLFIEGKMRALFGMLFGASAYLLLSSVEAKRAAAPADIFARRNLWLVFFGLVHGIFIWNGDILLQYGLCALLLLYPLRLVKPRTLLAAGLVLWLAGGTLGVSNFVDARKVMLEGTQAQAAAATLAAGATPTAAQTQALAAVSGAAARDRKMAQQAVNDARASYLEQLPANAGGYADFTLSLFKYGWILEIMGQMLTGMALLQLGFLSGKWSRRAYVRVAIVGYAVSSSIVLFGVHRAVQSNFALAEIVRWMYLPYELEQIPAVMANASVVILLATSDWARNKTSLLGNVGKTALSNYIATSLVCQTIFIWGPWPLYGALEYYQYLYVVVAVWILNLAASLLWLRHFHTGPLEWVWRSLTYWQRQPLRKHAPAGAHSVIA